VISSIARRAGSSGSNFRCLLLAQTVAAELEAVGIVNDAVEDGVSECRLSDQGVPAVDRDLAGDQGGAAAIAVLDDFEHVMPPLGPERLEAPIVEDQQLHAAEGTHDGARQHPRDGCSRF